MLGDRLFKRVKETDFVVFDGMTKAYKSREENWKWSNGVEGKSVIEEM